MNPFGGSVPPTPGTGRGFTFPTFIELREERRFLYTKNGRLRAGGSGRGVWRMMTPEVGISAGTGHGLTGSRQRNERSETWTTRN